MRKILSLFLIFFLLCSPCYAGVNKPPLGSRINWSHPLAKGLVGCWLMNEGGGVRLKDLCALNDGIISNLSQIYLKNAGLYFTDDNSNVQCKSGVILGGKANFSVVSMVNTKAPTQDGPTVDNYLSMGGNAIYCERGSSGNDILKLEMTYNWPNQSGGTQVVFTYRNDAGVLLQVGAAKAGLNNGQNYQIALTKSATHRIFLDGKQVNSAFWSSNNNFTDATNASWIGSDKGDEYAGWYLGYIFHLYLYNRVLSPSEIQQLYIDPYCFIKRPSLFDWYKAAEADGLTLGSIINNAVINNAIIQ